MVLKKTNCEWPSGAINSGNTMRRRYIRYMITRRWHDYSCVIKSIHHVEHEHVPFRDAEPWQLEAAAEYVDDGDMKCTLPYLFHWRTMSDAVIYSLNKHKRWLLKDAVREALLTRELRLSDESFKITLTCHAIPCVRNPDFFCNLSHYYDSQLPLAEVMPNNNRRSFREGLVQKARAGQHTAPGSSSRSKKRPGHNQHFRGLQRKTVRPRNTVTREATAEPVTENIPEIRYSIPELEPLNSHGVHETGNTQYLNGRRRYRIYPSELDHRAQTFDCRVDFLPANKNRKIKHNYTAEFSYKASLPEEECEEEEEDSQWSPPPAQRKWTLSELAVNFRPHPHHHHHHGPTPLSCTSTKDTDERSLVNTASSQTVRRHAKGTAIVVSPPRQHEGEDTSEGDDDSSFQTLFDSEADESADNYHNSSAAERVAPASLVYSDADFQQFDECFSSCAVQDSELRVSHLRSVFGQVVEIGSCVPFTFRFDLRAVWQKRVEEAGWLQGEGVLPPGDWWLLCQTCGDNSVEREGSQDGRGETTGAALPAGTEVMKCRVLGGDCDSEEEGGPAVAANENLRCALSAGFQSRLVTSLCELVNRACSSVLCQSASARSLAPSTVGGGDGGGRGVVHSRRRYRGALDVHLPHLPYTSQVQVCSLELAYQHLASSATALDTQCSQQEEVSLSCSVEWCWLECSVCFTHVSHAQSSPSDCFTFFLAMTTCGHSFCRRCWQRHLVSGIAEGKTTLRCMEYKCETEVDATTVMSLVPGWVYTRWQQRVRNVAVERSGEWRWCPNSRCGLLARTVDRPAEQQKDKEGHGVPVRCGCGDHWCLHCGQRAHWPLTCQLQTTYLKMLRQKGEEEGMKSVYTEISSVSVKRCPSCSYPMEKSGGCSHMQCSICQKDFCWVCLREWRAHVIGDWTGCTEKKEETVELSNERNYPLPVQCYKHAVSYRYMWKELDRQQHATLAAFHNCMRVKFSGHRAGLVHRDALTHVLEALQFMKKGLMMMELLFIVLSHYPRRKRQARLLRAFLPTLSFFCDRVAQYLKRPVRQVLMTSGTLDRLTTQGERQVQRACRLTHCLLQSTNTSTTSQDWLLQADHERFVRYK